MSLAQFGQKRSRISRLASVGSQFLNVLLFNGHPSESISGRAYRRGVLHGSKRWLTYQRIVDKIFFWEKDHCKNAHILDISFSKFLLDK